MQGRCLLEDGLLEAYLQLPEEEGKMDNAVVARFLKSHEAFELESPEVELEVAVELPDADEAVVLGGMGVMVEIDQVVDGGLLGTYAEGLVVVMKVETEVGGCMEVVLPAEMVGVIL